MAALFAILSFAVLTYFISALTECRSDMQMYRIYPLIYAYVSIYNVHNHKKISNVFGNSYLQKTYSSHMFILWMQIDSLSNI